MVVCARVSSVAAVNSSSSHLPFLLPFLLPSPIPQNPTLPEFQLVPESLRARKLSKIKILVNGNLQDESPQEYVDKGVVRDKKMEDINVGDRHLPLYFGLQSVPSIVKKLTPEFVGTLKNVGIGLTFLGRSCITRLELYFQLFF